MSELHDDYAEAVDQSTEIEGAVQAERERIYQEVVAPLVEALEKTQFGFMLCRCPVCAGWNMSPNGETNNVHTKDCPVAAALATAREQMGKP